MYDFVEIVQLYQPNAQCVHVLSLIILVGLDWGPRTPRIPPPLATPMYTVMPHCPVRRFPVL